MPPLLNRENENLGENCNAITPGALSDEPNELPSYVWMVPREHGKSKSASTRAKRKVRFASVDRVYEHVHFRDMTYEELAMVWMGHMDYALIREIVHCTVHLMRKTCSLISNENIDSRGLEYMLNDESTERIKAGRNAVLGVQEFLRHAEGDCSSPASELIAAVYGACSSHALTLAYDRGVQDFEDILPYTGSRFQPFS